MKNIQHHLKTLLIFFILFINIASIYGQNFFIQGRIVDAKEGVPLPGAYISLVDHKKNTTATDKNGMFKLANLKAGSYSMQISFIGYKTLLKKLTLTSNANLGDISLEAEMQNVQEVVVTGKAVMATQKSDTIQLNASAFKVNPDVNAEDMLKKIPGVVVQDGKVQAQGEDVKKILIDGKPFFDQDPTLGIKSLPAEMIQQIQIFEEQSDQAKFTGFDDGQRSKTINIITKNNIKSGHLGKFYIGYGTDEKYQAGGNINIINGNRRIAVITQLNNVNQQNFSAEDLLGVVGTSDNRRGFGMDANRSPGLESGQGMGKGFQGGNRPGSHSGSSSSDFMVGQQAGISTTHAFGLNYSDKWRKKINISGSYFVTLRCDTSCNGKKNSLLFKSYPFLSFAATKKTFMSSLRL